MVYRISFQYFGENAQFERDFNIDSLGIVYVYKDIYEFQEAIKLFSDEKIRINDNNYISKGGIFDISDNTIMSYISFIKHENEYIFDVIDNTISNSNLDNLFNQEFNE